MLPLMSDDSPSRIGRVSLLGAGPGDPELITARAMRRLGEADVVLYDALIHPDLLKHSRKDAELIFVGKRAGRASERQTRINDLLIETARQGKRVVRLKGGDPYLFGRGSEEAEALHDAGIDFEVVPGVASPMAASAYTGISLTHRDLASSVAYVTATESVEKDASAHDWSKLATATQTIVLFMGLRKLGSLMKLLMEHGRPPDTPAAVVSSASLPSQQTVLGTVSDIAERAQAAGVRMPALTIVGPVVELRQRLAWYEMLPLFGQRVLVTRPRGLGHSMAQALRDAGAEPIELPTIAIVPPLDRGPLCEAARRLSSYDWVVFTSVNGVRYFFDALWEVGGDSRAFARARVAAIGPATARVLREHGLRADVVPSEYRGEAVAEAVVATGASLSGARVLLPRAEVARPELPDRLRRAGATVDVVPAYRTVPPDEAQLDGIRQRLRSGSLDVITLTSPSTVQQLVRGLGPDAQALLQGLTLAAIGPVTAKAARELGLNPRIVAGTYTTEGLVDALIEKLPRKRRG